MKIKGVTGRTYVDLQQEINHLLETNEMEEMGNTITTSRLNRAVDQLKQTVTHLRALIHHYGLCRPETQLARMELGEASMRYVSEKNYDEKNLGAIAKHVLQEMREKGELPDED
jgi:hypothetical protein